MNSAKTKHYTIDDELCLSECEKAKPKGDKQATGEYVCRTAGGSGVCKAETSQDALRQAVNIIYIQDTKKTNDLTLYWFK